MVINPKVSVIVPVYNSEKYLLKCLDTLIFQTYTNLEIICIDDGSTDMSLEILNKYASKDSRIKVLTQVNGGASLARNAGMKIATGDYISFIDSDDWVYLTLYQTFADAVKSEEDIDIWMFNIASYAEGKNDIVPKLFFESSDWKNHTSNEVKHVFDDCRRPFSRNLSAANKIYRSEFLKSIDLQFPVGLKFEDQYFSIKAFLNAKTIKFTEDVFYRYRNYHESSISSVVSGRAFDIFQIMDLIEQEINRLKVYESYKYAFFQYKYINFAQRYMFCPEFLKDNFYREMQKRLLNAYANNLDPQVAVKLSMYKIFEAVQNEDRKEFEKIFSA